MQTAARHSITAIVLHSLSATTGRILRLPDGIATYGAAGGDEHRGEL